MLLQQQFKRAFSSLLIGYFLHIDCQYEQAEQLYIFPPKRVDTEAMYEPSFIRYYIICFIIYYDIKRFSYIRNVSICINRAVNCSLCAHFTFNCRSRHYVTLNLEYLANKAQLNRRQLQASFLVSLNQLNTVLSHQNHL